MIIVNDLKTGSTFLYENNLYTVLENTHNKTAMRQMIIKTKVKNVRTGVITEITFTGGDKVEQVDLERKSMQYIYDNGTELVFMDLPHETVQDLGVDYVEVFVLDE